MKRDYETCADCSEFPCKKFDTWFDADSFVTHQKCLSNIQEIKKTGIKEFLHEQGERKNILEIMLEKYNPGRSATLYCLASALMNPESLKKAIKQIESVKEDKPKSFKMVIQEYADEEKTSLKLRK
ncbi:MAG: DUF3795 domain-containing protein [Methanospirillum sp.]|nr:DUF3795 domain-containing protein [Methanospirillum sp.]MDD1728927.1 DUF3795 domain-containing protein [Methanospirillum sp.]